MPAGSQLDVFLFGQPRVLAAGRLLKFAKHQVSLSLLAYLIVHRGETVSRTFLAFTLFPDESEENALAELRRYLSLANKTLPPRSDGTLWINADADSVSWNDAVDCHIDVLEFERLAAGADTLASAVDMYGGDFLENVYDDWVVTKRERLRTTYISALGQLILVNRSRRDYAAAIGCAQRLLIAEPWREDALRQLMAARYGSADAAGALAEYARFAERLLAEMHVEPMPETVAVRDAIVRNAALPSSLDTPADANAKRNPAAAGLPFVGRSNQIEQLRMIWSRAAHGLGSVVFVGGEAGIGKSRLLSEFALAVESEGGRVAVGSTTYPEDAPYQCVVDALRSMLPTLLAYPPEKTALAVLAQVLPEIRARFSDLESPPPLPAEREATRLLDVLARAAVELSRARPALIGFEDLHWAGNATTEALATIARRVTQSPVLVIATYREDEVAHGHPLRALIRDLTHQHLASELTLGRLPKDDVRALLGAHPATALALSDETTERLYIACEGNPFFLNEAIAEFAERGNTAGPSSSAAIVASRIDRLSERARAVAEIAAIAGQAFNIDFVREVGGLDQSQVREGVNELLDRGIVRDAGSRSRFDYAFSHHLIAQAIYQRIDAAARLRRHARAAYVLEQFVGDRRDEFARDLAFHYELGGLPESATGWYAVAARSAAKLYANDEALAFAAKAIAGTGDATRLVPLVQLSEALRGRRGDRDGQRNDIDLLERLAESGGEDAGTVNGLRSDILHRRILLSRSLGESDEENRWIAALRQLARDSGDDAAHADAALQLATHLVLVSRPREGLPHARRALKLYEANGDVSKQIECLWLLVDAATNLGDFGSARRYLEKLRQRAAESSDRTAQARALAVAATEALLHQRYRECYDLTHEGLTINLDLGDREAEAASRARIAVTAAWLGLFDEAMREFSIALDVYSSIGHRRGLATTLTNKTLFAMRLGLFDEAKDLIRRSGELLAPVREVRIAVANAVNLSFINLHLGDAQTAKRFASLALDEAREIDFPVFEAAALANLGNAERELGDYATAIGHMVAGLDIRRKVQEPGDFADDLSDLALAYAQAGFKEDARRTADELASIATISLEGAFWPQYVWWTLSRVYRTCGDRSLAEHAASKARFVLQEFAAKIGHASSREAFLAVDVNQDILSGSART
ncbi:MAG TPA: AAA family ATPase [Candidatus Eremiobacteraceae bacterium]|jgi:DNA-binding SARP family transcriptional activator/tetratricopeptide (TPR) repeat protein